MPKKITDAPASPGSSTPRPSRSRAAEVARGGNGNTGNIELNHNDIAEAAYQRYLKRGCAHGQDVDDWMEAERELRAQRASR